MKGLSLGPVEGLASMLEAFEHVRPRLWEQTPPNVGPVAPAVALTTRLLRWWWLYRVETAVLRGIYILCVILNAVLGPDRAALVAKACLLLVLRAARSAGERCGECSPVPASAGASCWPRQPQRPSPPARPLRAHEACRAANHGVDGDSESER